MIQSPLNYTGGKYKLLPQILPLFPKDINCFVDLFCGGCNVGINVCAKKYVYNDSCEPLINLYSVMQTLDSASFIEKIETVIKRYGLSDVKLYGYDFYNCNSSDGLGVYNRDKYMKLRADFNALKERTGIISFDNGFVELAYRELCACIFEEEIIKNRIAGSISEEFSTCWWRTR